MPPAMRHGELFGPAVQVRPNSELQLTRPWRVRESLATVTPHPDEAARLLLNGQMLGGWTRIL
jgi:hypothetical protein